MAGLSADGCFLAVDEYLNCGWLVLSPGSQSRTVDAISHGARQVGFLPELPLVTQLDAQSGTSGGTDRPRKGDAA